MDNEQGLPSTEKICLEQCMKGCALQLHHPIVTLSFTDSVRTNIYERDPLLVMGSLAHAHLHHEPHFLLQSVLQCHLDTTQKFNI